METSMLVLLDLSAALDTNDHKILLARLQSYYAVSDTACLLKRLSSCFTGRMQFVPVLGRESEPVPLPAVSPKDLFGDQSLKNIIIIKKYVLFKRNVRKYNS